MRSALRTTILCTLAALTPAAASYAAALLIIQSAVLDACAGTVTVAGSGFGQRPFVTLDRCRSTFSWPWTSAHRRGPFGMMPPAATCSPSPVHAAR
jgi:hypothetical protein